MRILHLIDRMNPQMGGVCQAVRTIASSLEDLDASNVVVSLDDPLEAFLENDNLDIKALGPANNPWCYSASLLPWLFENLEKYDVIIIHGLWQFHSFAANFALNKLKQKHKNNKQEKAKIPRMYVMPHGMLDPFFQNASDRKIKAVRNWIYWKLVESKVVNNSDGLLFTCEAEKLLARKPFSPYHPKQELVVGLGVEEPPVFEISMRNAFLSHCPELEDKSYILFLSRIHSKKGVDLLVKAYSKIANEISRGSEPTSFPKLVIAGPGIESHYGQYIANLIEENDLLRNNILLPGMLKGAAKWGAFYGCESFILPSHQENFGIAVVESLACGKPVLISDQVNIWKEIIESNAGLVEKDSEEGTFRLLKAYLNLTKNEKDVICKNTLKAFNEFFSVDKASKRLYHALSKIN